MTGVLTLIPKQGDLRRLTNWRPICLLNTDYKIISKSLANRISKVIHNIVSNDQTCCVPGRDIAENVLIMQNMISYVNDNNLNGLALKIDQYKAFDRVDHDYIFDVLHKFGFGPNFRKWVKILYTDIYSCIKHNGFISESLPIQRGVRQGCPLSALLYVLSAEPFHEAIINSDYISGIKFCETEFRLFQHADDTTFFVSSITSIYSILKVIKLYERASGSTCNIDKTELLAFGRARVTCDDFDFPVTRDYIKVLGIAIGNNTMVIENVNWKEKVKNCNLVLRRWKGRNLSFKGKSLIINSLVVSRLIYNITILPVPDWVISSMRQSIIDFIWRGKKGPIKYASLLLPFNKGGLNLRDIEIVRDSIRCKFISKILDSSWNVNLRNIMLYFLNHYDNMSLGVSIFQTVPNKKSLLTIHPYYREMLLAWKKITNGRLLEPLT